MASGFEKSLLEKLFDGDAAAVTVIRKFGRNAIVGTAPVALTASGKYPMPQSAVSIEAVSDSANDTAAGTGGQAIQVEGLDSNFDQQTEIVELNGTVPVALQKQFIRIYRWSVVRSGTYANAMTAGSHAGTLTLREAGGGATWFAIAPLSSGYGVSQSQIGAFTVPRGHKAFILSSDVTVDTVQPANVSLFVRTNANDVTAPYSGVAKLNQRHDGVTGHIPYRPFSSQGPYPEYTDIFYVASTTASTAAVAIDFEIALAPVPSETP